MRIPRRSACLAAGAGALALFLAVFALAGLAAPAQSPDRRPPAVAGTDDPTAVVSSPVMHGDHGFWTPERMRNAKPSPMDTRP